MDEKTKELHDTQKEVKKDDFLEACKEAGLLVVDEEELPEGIGAATYEPRLSAPSSNDKNWIHYTAGGFNYCIKIYGNSCLPNCVGYAWGRWRELLGKFHNLSRMNAEDWWGHTSDGYERGLTPRLGAVICWRRGRLWDDSDGAGHVAIVERINPDGSITCSNSAYYSTYFYLSNHYPPYSFGLYEFQGFIYNPLSFTPESGDLVVDGIMGPASVRKWQEWAGTFADGVISDQDIDTRKYYTAIVSVEFGEGGSAFVRALQRYLIGKGYSITADGYLGPSTVKAWQKHLKKNGYNINPDGYFGAATAKATQKFLNGK